MPLVSQTSVRVRYADTDQMGVAHHAAHIVWLETGRTEFCRAAGFSYAEMEADGVGLPVVEAVCRYRAPARFEDDLVVLTRLKDLRKKRIEFAYRVQRSSDDKLISEGETLHIPVDRAGNACAVPEKYYARLTKALEE